MKAFAAAAAISLAPLAFAAAQPAGHWEMSAEGEPSIHLIYPEYSELSWAVFRMSCDPGRRTVEFTQDTGLDKRPPSASIPLRVDGKPYPLSGALSFNEMDGFWYRSAKAPYHAPVVRALTGARALGLDGSPRTMPLPADRLRASLTSWLRACRLR